MRTIAGGIGLAVAFGGWYGPATQKTVGAWEPEPPLNPGQSKSYSVAHDDSAVSAGGGR
jgi:hypothetical protein